MYIVKYDETKVWLKFKGHKILNEKAYFCKIDFPFHYKLIKLTKLDNLCLKYKFKIKLFLNVFDFLGLKK